MRPFDVLRFAAVSLAGARTRALLMLLAMSIGVASVIILTALGEGARRYVVGEFTQLGTHLLIMLPGRAETTGGAPPLLGETPRDLTLDDALALLRERSIARIAPLTIGNAPVSFAARRRDVTIMGTTAAFFPIRHLSLQRGQPLPESDTLRGSNVVVLGGGLRKALFDAHSGLGQWIRINDRRFRVIGVLGEGGESLGQNLDDMAIMPVVSAQSLFNTPSLFRILIEARNGDVIERAKRGAREIIRERHDGEDDVTIITQDALLATFDRILGALTYTVAGIAAISLIVAGVLIMNVMLVAVSQRVKEIGLLQALGAPRGQVLRLFLVESVLLASAGALFGVVVGQLGIYALSVMFPLFPVAAPLWAPLAAVSVAVATGLIFGIVPARRAAALDPVLALSGR